MAAASSGLYQTVERTVGGLGYQLVDVEWLGGGLLRVTMDAKGGIGLEDCEKVSRQLSHLFAVEDVDYQRLEVSSPGLDRPLKNVNDFRRFVGSEVNVQLFAPGLDGRKRLRGRLLQVAGSNGGETLQLQLTPDEAPVKHGRRGAKRRDEATAVVVDVALADVEKARLVPELNFRPGARRNDGGEVTSGMSSGESVQ